MREITIEFTNGIIHKYSITTYQWKNDLEMLALSMDNGKHKYIPMHNVLCVDID